MDSPILGLKKYFLVGLFYPRKKCLIEITQFRVYEVDEFGKGIIPEYLFDAFVVFHPHIFKSIKNWSKR